MQIKLSQSRETNTLHLNSYRTTIKKLQGQAVNIINKLNTKSASLLTIWIMSLNIPALKFLVENFEPNNSRNALALK